MIELQPLWGSNPANGGPLTELKRAFSCIGCDINSPGEGGGVGTQQSFIRGGSAPRSKPLPFYIPFLVEKVPLFVILLQKMVLSYTFGATFTNLFTWETLKILGWISRQVRLFEIFWISLLIPKLQFSQPFSILQLVTSIPFYIPPA